MKSERGVMMVNGQSTSLFFPPGLERSLCMCPPKTPKPCSWRRRTGRNKNMMDTQTRRSTNAFASLFGSYFHFQKKKNESSEHESDNVSLGVCSARVDNLCGSRFVCFECVWFNVLVDKDFQMTECCSFSASTCFVSHRSRCRLVFRLVVVSKPGMRV